MTLRTHPWQTEKYVSQDLTFSSTAHFMPIRRIAGCADAFGISARRSAEGVSLPAVGVP
jgi:hypothetical protein